jgi:CRISPR-associated protein Cmr4
MGEPDRDQVFGKSDNAGSLLVSDARLLLLPVRSLSSAYKWVTCPHLIERYARDTLRGGGAPGAPHCVVAQGNYLGAGEGPLFLEERQFGPGGALPGGLEKLLAPLIPHATTRARLAGQIVVLNDDDFAWFARYGLAVQARNVLDPQTKASLNLWYEEALPSDSLFYALLAERGDDAIARVRKLFVERAYLQVGGNETVGMGWFAVAFPGAHGGAV